MEIARRVYVTFQTVIIQFCGDRNPNELLVPTYMHTYAMYVCMYARGYVPMNEHTDQLYRRDAIEKRIVAPAFYRGLRF